MSYLRVFIFTVLFCSLLSIVSRVFADSKPVINEFLPHPSNGDKEWVELYVPDGIDITNYWIDDDTDFISDTGSSSKKRITSMVQGSDAEHVVFELSSFMFNNSGDTVALFSSDGALIDQYAYASDPGADVSIGRTPDGTGGFQVLASATRGSPNSSPKPTDTPTPVPTMKPAAIPKPTVTPKQIMSETTISTVNDKAILADEISVSQSEGNAISGTQTASISSRPTSVLRTRTKSSKKSNTIVPKQMVMVAGSSSSLPKFIAMSIGGVLFIACGILVYLKKLKVKN
ncbi:MAG TPA: lamin tail domain-containing protein [Candidatus Acidoferrales bacterium]|nr:lamin tail domain-containing protein [Candidatus Acidoferrales bacterium]